MAVRAGHDGDDAARDPVGRDDRTVGQGTRLTREGRHLQIDVQQQGVGVGDVGRDLEGRTRLLEAAEASARRATGGRRALGGGLLVLDLDDRFLVVGGHDAGELQDARAAHRVVDVEDQRHLAEGEDAAHESAGGRAVVAIDEGRDAVGEEGVAVLVGKDEVAEVGEAEAGGLVLVDETRVVGEAELDGEAIGIVQA